MSKQAPVHAPIEGFPVEDGCLCIGDIPLTQLAERVGQTPFYAYDRQLLTDRVAQLRQHLPEGVHLSYAVKSNPMPALLQHLAGIVDGFDLASGGELKKVLDTPVSSADVSFAGPAKTQAELRQAIAAGVLINMESENEMESIAKLGHEMGMRPRVAVRINPDFEVKTSGLKMGGGPKQFGVDAERVPAMLERIGQLDLDFEGFHVYSGSQAMDYQQILEMQEKTIELTTRLAPHVPSPVRTFNLGGGFGIPYFPGQTPLDLAALGKGMETLLSKAKAIYPDAKIVIELGRYIVADAGIYVAKIIDRKISRGLVYLITDGGLHHHLTASGNLGTVIRRNFPVTIGNKMDTEVKETASVVGALCTPFDLLADKMELAVADIGDLVVIFRSGAYGPSASPGGFLSHPQVTEVLV